MSWEFRCLRPKQPPHGWRHWFALLCAGVLGVQATPAAAQCVDEQDLDAWVRATAETDIAPADPRATLVTMVHDAIDRSNAVLAQFPISEIRLFNLLNSQEPTPGSDTGSWDRQVANLEILGVLMVESPKASRCELISSQVIHRILSRSFPSCKFCLFF